MTFSQLNIAISEGTFGNTAPTAVFLDRTDWADLYERYPKEERGVKFSRIIFMHFVVNGVPVMASNIPCPGVITVVNSDKPFDGAYNFSTRAD